MVATGFKMICVIFTLGIPFKTFFMFFFLKWVEGKIETAGSLLSINKLNMKVSSVLRPSFSGPLTLPMQLAVASPKKKRRIGSSLSQHLFLGDKNCC